MANRLIFRAALRVLAATAFMIGGVACAKTEPAPVATRGNSGDGDADPDTSGGTSGSSGQDGASGGQGGESGTDGSSGASGDGGTGGTGGSSGAGGDSGSGGSGGDGTAPETIVIDFQVEKLLVDPTRPVLYALDSVNNNLHFIDTETGAVEDAIFVGSKPVHMDITEDGAEMFIANFGSTEIAIVDLETRQLSRSIFVDTSQGTWDGNPYRLVLTANDTLVFTSEDQWNSLKLVRRDTGLHLADAGSVYAPGLVANAAGTSVYVAASFDGVMRFDLEGETLVMNDASGSGSGGGSRDPILTADEAFVFQGARKHQARNLEAVLGEFGEGIHAANSDGTIAVGSTNIFHGTMFHILEPLPFTTTVMAMSPNDRDLWLYDSERGRIHAVSLPTL